MPGRSIRAPARKGILKLAALALLLIAANVAAGWTAEALEMELRPSTEPAVHRMIMATAALYALLMAMPFVPGVEVGLALMAILGPPIAVLVYLCTVTGLSVAYLIGRLAGLAALARLLQDLGLARAAALLRGFEPLQADERVALLLSQAPGKIVPLLVRHRYLALAVTLNLPGNIVLGGGGGIALLAGLSRIYSIPGFLATVAVAVAPVPLGVLLLGEHVIGG